MLDENKLIAQIEAMMSENETIKNNAMSATIAKSSDTARRMYNNARAENNAYQKVLDFINEITLPKEQ